MTFIDAARLLFWPVLALIVAWLLSRAVLRIRQYGWGRTILFCFMLAVTLWFAFVVGTRVYTIATHGGNAGSVWPIYWPLALAILLAGVIYEVQDFDPPAFRWTVIAFLVAIAAYLVLLVSLPNLMQAAGNGSSVRTGDASAAAFSWESYTPHTGTSGLKCLTKVTGVTQADAKSWAKLVKEKKYDPRMLVVVNEPSTTVAEARTQAAAQGVPRVTKLPVLHVAAVWTYDSTCSPTLDSHPGVLVSITIPTRPNHPTTSHARKDVGVLPEPQGPWKVATAPAAA